MLGTRAVTGNGGKEALTVAQWSPLVDITEDEKEYLIRARVAGHEKEDVRLTVENEVLAISGERKIEKEEKGKKYRRVERAYGSFVRSILPSGGCGWEQGVCQLQRRDAPRASPEIRKGEAESHRDQGALVV